MTSHPLSRADRRRATEARILDSARELFAAKGFDRTTIRAVASSAGVDPALVMQYFDSKRGLFTRAVQAPPAAQASVDGDALLGHLMATLGVKLGGMPDGTLAMLRSMLTDPASAEHARETLDRQITAIGDALSADDGGGEYGDGSDGSDAELRAALIVTTMVGVTIGHQLLGLAALRDVPADRVTALLRPALDALTRPAG
ncbi:TetR/AcrR family transcriptional regulator [Streptomyces sp. NBC_01104]|uniref:TetR/AcrR family transcriptional regulator n=1 Tax=Streptomyces sp. NBC_01104 TaxID=2903750 RepID=UPI003864631A|nr:TetR family transcriptional regulator [Streptomyces sp. NBC_01104]